MEPLILQTASEDAGKRLDAWLAEQTEPAPPFKS